jgi:hypothetical protein
MRFFSTTLLLAACLALMASAEATQPPKGKKDGKGDPKGNMSNTEMIDDIISRMMAFDMNKDGKLTREEITDNRLLRLFDRADLNKDGVVTGDELSAVAKQMVDEFAAEGGGKGGKGGPGGPGDKKGGPGGEKKGGPGGPGGGKGGKGGPGGPGGPGGGKGGPGEFGGLPQPGLIVPIGIQNSLNLSADQRKQIETLQSEIDARLEKILNDEQRKQLKEMRDRGPGKE